MNMGIIQVVAVGILSAVLALTLKKQSPEIALMITIAASVLIFFMTLPLLTQTIGIFTKIGAELDGGLQYVGLALRVVGVAYMAELGASVCTDAGESAIAMKIDLAGRILILVMAMPIIIDIVGIAVGLLP
jgi:stage III sporulation protein AD